MFQYILPQRCFLFILVMALGTVGCRLDNDGSVNSEVKQEDSDRSADGGESDDEKTHEPEIEKEDAGGSSSVDVIPNTLTGTVSDNVTALPLANMRVVALNNEDLSELGIETITEPDGSFALEGITEERICIQVAGTEGEDARIDTFTCNVPSDQKGRDFISCPYDIANMIMTNMSPNFSMEKKSALAKENGIVAISGSVYYIDDTGEEIPVDCATVEVAEAMEDTGIFYFKSGLPDKGAVQTDSRGRFLVTWLAPGRVHLSAFANGKKIGSVSTPIRPPVDPASDKDLHSLYFVRVYADAPGDPTPDCDQ